VTQAKAAGFGGFWQTAGKNYKRNCLHWGSIINYWI